MADTIQTISPNTLSHSILQIFRDHLIQQKMLWGNRYGDIPWESANYQRTKLDRDFRRLTPIQLNRRIARLYDISKDDIYDPVNGSVRAGWDQAKVRMVNSGLIHIRWRWLNTVDGKNELLIPDFCITDEGVTALSYLDSGAYFILSWSGVNLNEHHTPKYLAETD